MLRRIAVVGDRLDTGGEILRYEGPIFTFGGAGHQVALIGKEAWCNACNSAGAIARSGGPRRMNLGMGDIAADGDVVLCRCAEPPRIAARLAGEAWYDDLAESMGAVASSPAVSASALSAQVFFDEQVRSVGRGAGEGYPWFIEMADGRTAAGRLDSTALLPRIYTDAAREYTVHWGDEALAKGAT